MSRYFLNFLCALITGAIVFLGAFFMNKLGIKTDTDYAMFLSILVAIACYLALIPKVFNKIKHLCNDYDWAEEVIKIYKSIPIKYRQSFWILFGFINLAFLFHTINFMWGNEDWAAIRTNVDHNEALRAGSFSAYWLQELLFDGKILPVINNLWAFLGLSLAGVLLAIYWNLPQRATPIVVTSLLAIVTPYALGVLYFSKTTLGVCWLPAMVLTALLIAEKKATSNIYTYLYNLASILLFLVALGTYMPIINFVGVVIIGQMIIKTVYADISTKSAAHRVLQGLANFMAAVMIYLLILTILKETNQLVPEHADAINLITPLINLPYAIKLSFAQFAEPMPFMDIVYKAMYILLSLIALFTLIFKAQSAFAAARGLILVPLVIIISLLAIAFTIDPYEHLVRMSFLGLPYVYALFFVLIIKMGGKYLCRIGYALAILLIFMNFVRVSYAQKVWKFGWDAETKLAERIITRLEKMPEFDINHQYKLLQIGEKSLREKYYQKQPYEQANGELLDRAYYPAGASKDAYNFFYQTDFLSDDAEEEALENPEVRSYLLNRARVWPAKEGLFITGNYIVIVLDEKSLAEVQNYLSH